MSVLRTPMERRHFLRVGAASVTVSLSGWLGNLAAVAATNGQKPRHAKHCILLWMNGGPSTIDLWDLKVGHKNGGPYKELTTNAPGLKIGEHLPKLAAEWGNRLAVVRSLATKEGDHGRASYLMRTGNLPMGAIQFPTLGSLLSKELGNPTAELPNFVSVAPQRFFNTEAYGPGFLGPQFAPLVVGDGGFGQPNVPNIDDVLKVKNLTRPVDVPTGHADERLDLLRQMQEDFAASRPGSVTAGHVAAYDRASRLMRSEAGKAFDLTRETAADRDRYGRNLFGQGCLLARRLIESGVSFVEVTLGGWDTHQNNFDQVKNLCGTLDSGWSALMADLKARGLLDSTLIVWMGEFGRTPVVNQQRGRDHFPNAWSAVLAGGGIKGGQAIGRTSADGTTVEDRPVSTPDLLATVCRAVGVDPEKQNPSNVGRPIRIVDKSAEPIAEVLL